MPWQTPKTNWAVGDGVSNSDFNRIEENIGYLKDSPALNAPTVTTQASGDSSTKVASTAFATGQDFGIGQTPQDLTSNRVAGTTYTNTTGKPILVSVILRAGSSDFRHVYLNGVVWAKVTTNTTTLEIVQVIIPVPSGSTYSVQVGTTIDLWTELR